MANGNYTYNPAEIKDKTVSRMRFELGDTMVEGNSDTAALTDEEIQVAIDSYPKSWKKAKLMLLESLYRRFSYEVDTKTGPLTLNLHDRAVMWKEDYLALKKEIQQESCSVPPFAGGATNKPPYFYTGMQQISSTGRVVNKHSGNGTKTLKGCLANATDKDIENHSIQDHIVTHTIVQSGPPKAKRTDRLILGERSFYICDVDEVGGLGFSTLYYAEERRDLQ